MNAKDFTNLEINNGNHQVEDVETATDPNGLHPMVLGYLDGTEILREGSWEPYLDFSDDGDTWLASGCVLQHGEMIYSILDSVWALDTSDPNFEAVEVAEVASQFRAPGRCAILEVNGEAGEHFKVVS